MTALRSLVFAALLVGPSVHGLKYLVGPDPEGRAALVSLTSTSTSSCALNLPALPIPDLTTTVQTLIDGRLVVCGGRRPGHSYHNRHCFQLSADSAKWDHFPSMDAKRAGAVAMWIDNGRKWWVTGGRDAYGLMSSSSVYDTETKKWGLGQNLPRALTGHCLTELLDGRILLNGGDEKVPTIVGEQSMYDVYILNGTTWERQKESIHFPRYGLSQTCARLPNGNVMMVGGKPVVDDIVEIYNTHFGNWDLADASGSLPLEHVWYPTSAVDELGNVYVIGGEVPGGPSDGILKWDQQRWTVIEHGLPFPMTSVAATLVGDQFQCAE